MRVHGATRPNAPQQMTELICISLQLLYRHLPDPTASLQGRSRLVWALDGSSSGRLAAPSHFVS